MSQADTQKLAHALFTYYVNLFKIRYHRDPNVNRYRDKWGLVDVIESVGYERARELLEYYFHIEKPGHPLSHFLYNFDKMNTSYENRLADKERTAKLLKESKERVQSST